MALDSFLDIVTLCSVITCNKVPGVGDYVCNRPRPLGDCLLCCSPDNERDIRFMVYTPNNTDTPDAVLVGQSSVLKASHYDMNLPTVFYIHGFTEIYTGESGQTIKDAYMKRGGWNVVLVDWHKLAAGPYYLTAADNVKRVGNYIAEFITFLEKSGVAISSIHVLGFSLGGETAGFAGMALDGRLPRITGLDPAEPAFTSNDLRTHLSPADAVFVDVIHTSGGILGYSSPLGHVDFYPDGGTFHKGCGAMNIVCDHHRAWRFYAESVNNECGFKANKCADEKQLKKEKCTGVVGYLGYAAEKLTPTRGQYYLKTKESSPYANNKDIC